MSPPRFNAAEALLHDALEARAFPAAAIEVGTSDGPLWQAAFGRLSYEPDAAPASPATIFDLSSLTKVIATATLAMLVVERKRLRLEDPVGRWLSEWRGTDREHVAVHDLLAHTSGLTAHLPFFRDHRGRQEFQQAICALPLEFRPRTQAVYSDLGFILLGFILEDAFGARLDDQFRSFTNLLGVSDLAFRPPAAWRRRTAPTEVDPWRGRTLVAEVHDENAWALGGVAGHAGLFGSVTAVAQFARFVLQSLRGATVLVAPEILQRFAARTDVPGSSRALAWDTMLPTSSCGHRMSARAIGHTGFTGTSIWIDPENDVYVALLTNRVHPTRANEAILALRPKIHDAIMEALAAGR